MATSKQLQKEIRRAGVEIKRTKLEVRKLQVYLKKEAQQQKRLDSSIKNLTKEIRPRSRIRQVPRFVPRYRFRP